MKILKLTLLVSIGISVFLSGYFSELVQRTQFFDKSTSITPGVIIGFHLLSAFAICTLIIGFIKRALSRILIVTVLVITLGAEGTFLCSNFTGNIWHIKKESPRNLGEYIGGIF